MHRGQVKWFSAEKGYGFITTSASPVDVFVHFSDIQMDGYKALKPEMVVEFEMRESGRGPSAQNVRPTDDEAPPSPLAVGCTQRVSRTCQFSLIRSEACAGAWARCAGSRCCARSAWETWCARPRPCGPCAACIPRP